MNPRQNQVIILDRDGVINQDSPEYIKSADEWIPIPGSLEALSLLSSHGFLVYIATNQAGIAKGKLTESDLTAIHQKLITEVDRTGGKISGIVYCPHHPDRDCQCRKPAPGMLNRIIGESGAKAEDVIFVGDSLKDIQAAEAACCQAVLVLTGNGLDTLEQRPDLERVHKDLLSFANHIISL